MKSFKMFLGNAGPVNRLLLLASLVVALGCQPSSPKAPSSSGTTEPKAPVASASASKTAPADAARAAEGTWEVLYLQGTKIGYGHTTQTSIRREGRQLLQTDSLNHLAITRFGQRTEQKLTMQTLELPTGELLEFKTEVGQGPASALVTGVVAGDKLRLTTSGQGQSNATQIPWSSDVQGFRAIEQSLERKPLKPGEKRSLKMLMPLLNQIAEVELVAEQVESTPVLGIDVKLLKIASNAKLADGQAIASSVWTNEAGSVVKTRVAALEQESFVTSRDIALAPSTGSAQLDLGLDLIVKVDPPLVEPNKPRTIRYKVEVKEGDPARIFPSGGTQTVKSLGPHAAEITVHRLTPSELKAPATPPAAVSTDYTSANSVLQIGDPRIQELAREAKGNLTNPQDMVVALEKFVHRAVNKKNFSHGFASAAEVAQTREGDCTEHAVLLAALARACGIPSRVAIGLVYVGSAGGFGYHMWTEVYIDGQWLPLDAIMGQGGASAAYLKLADSSLVGASAYSSFLSVAQVMGQLRVSVLATE